MNSWDIFGNWLAVFITIATLSYLYADNAFYKLAEHLFVGTSIGYVIVIQYFDVVKPNLIDKLDSPALGNARFIYLVALLMSLFLFLRYSKRFGWLGRISIAFIIGLYAGQNITAYANSDLVAQLQSTLASVQELSTVVHASSAGLLDTLATNWPRVLGVTVLVVGLVASLVYFFFSIEHKGVVGRVARLGVWVLMIGFGASFGYTVQGRISLAIGRAMFVLGTTQSDAEAAHLHTRLVAVLCVIGIFGTVVYLERRNKKLAGK